MLNWNLTLLNWVKIGLPDLKLIVVNAKKYGTSDIGNLFFYKSDFTIKIMFRSTDASRTKHESE